MDEHALEFRSTDAGQSRGEGLLVPVCRDVQSSRGDTLVCRCGSKGSKGENLKFRFHFRVPGII